MTYSRRCLCALRSKYVCNISMLYARMQYRAFVCAERGMLSHECNHYSKIPLGKSCGAHTPGTRHSIVISCAHTCVQHKEHSARAPTHTPWCNEELRSLINRRSINLFCATFKFSRSLTQSQQQQQPRQQHNQTRSEFEQM